MFVEGWDDLHPQLREILTELVTVQIPSKPEMAKKFKQGAHHAIEDYSFWPHIRDGGLCVSAKTILALAWCGANFELVLNSDETRIKEWHVCGFAEGDEASWIYYRVEHTVDEAYQSLTQSGEVACA
jgi:hypothetical protein